LVHDYKQLVVWQKAMDLVLAVYRISATFPRDERFGLTNQIRRAAVSVPSNIAEGQGRGIGRDFARFLRIANGSRQEVEPHLLAAQQLGFATPEDVKLVTLQIEEVGRLLQGLIRSVDTD